MTSTEDVSIFDFDSIDTYLAAIIRARKSQRKTFSLRLWATRMGLKPSESGNLSRIVSGQRDLPRRIAEKIAHELNLKDAELVYFELLSAGREKISSASLSQLKTCLRRDLSKDPPPTTAPFMPPPIEAEQREKI